MGTERQRESARKRDRERNRDRDIDRETERAGKRYSIPFDVDVFTLHTSHFAGIWDNMRLYAGASIGPSAITHASVSISYLFRMAGFPMVYAALTHMASEMLGVRAI